MAVTHISYDPTKPISALVAKVWADVAKVKGDLARIKVILDGLTDGGTTKTNIETGGTADGIAMCSVAAGSGASYYDAVVSMKSSIDGIAAGTLNSLDVGV